MNRSDVTRAVANLEGIPLATVEQVLGASLDVITLALAAGEPVNLRRFAKLEPRTRPAVTRRNPKTGEEIKVPERQTVAFLPSPSLKDRLNQS